MCTRGTNYQNPFGKDPITNRSIYKKANGTTPQTCRAVGFYPNFSPAISSLSVYSSSSGVYSLVYITGANFLPPSYGTTYVNFGSYTKLPITFYSSNNISFVVPLGALPGIYNVKVVNIYNGNFSPAVNQSYPGNQNNSNELSYQIIGYAINSGTYSITSNSQYNTIITFTANSSITFYRNYAINYIVVGGGGGGGSGQLYSTVYLVSSGGGGGGEVLSGTVNLSNNTYSILIGTGGLPGSASGDNGDDGNPSYINNGTTNIITANGGYGGQTGNQTGNNVGGNGGASGSYGSTGGAGGISNTSTPNGSIGILGGGGGGACYYSGNGGNGTLNKFVPIYENNFGAGGGGGTFDGSVGVGGNSNAGSGGYNSTAGNGIANTGGGGGGGGFSNLGGNGGSGVVILYFNA